VKKIHEVLLIPLITVASYIFCDDPTPDPEFEKLSFYGRMRYYFKQIMEEKS
jgi:hypothetical protein